MSPLGEKELLRRFFREVIGRTDLEWRNDAVVVSLDSETSLVYSVDRPGFIRGTTGQPALYYHGRWASGVVANDVIATGAKPRGISFDVGMGQLSHDDFLSFGRGVIDVCRQYGMSYEGGNLASGDEISGMAWGTVHPSRVIRRSGARPGAVILVTASIGRGWARQIWRHLCPAEQLPLDVEHYQDEPWVNLLAFEKVWDLGCIQCGMDVTDGIIEFGYEVLEQSGLGVEFGPAKEIDAVAQHVAHATGIPQEAMWFEPGYDTPYAHAWCVAKEDALLVTETLRGFGVQATIVGRTLDDEGVWAKRNDGERIALPRYWDDALRERGSVDRWLEMIVPLFR